MGLAGRRRRSRHGFEDADYVDPSEFRMLLQCLACFYILHDVVFMNADNIKVWQEMELARDRELQLIRDSSVNDAHRLGGSGDQ